MQTITPNTLNGIGEEYIPEKDIKDYVPRPTTRVFVIDRDRNIALIKHNGMLFPPGGGCEDGETVFEASKREVIEEFGIACEPVEDLGILEHYHEKWMKKFIIHHVYATTNKEEVKIDYEDYDTNLERVWMNINEYHKLLEDYNKKENDVWGKGIMFFIKELISRSN